MNDSGSKKVLFGILFGLFSIITFGLIWFFLGSSASPVGFGWYLFSFAAGLSMIVLPCTLPLAFVIVPLSMGKGVMKGFMIALAFGAGVALTLSVYGIISAVAGQLLLPEGQEMSASLTQATQTLKDPRVEIVKNWFYLIAGIFAYLFSLGQLGLIKFRMPSYSGALPGFIQKQQDVLKALLLGLFLGNIGVGCPHPATPMLLGRIFISEDIFYGWLLFFIHAVGRVLPLIFLAILGILGVNAIAGLIKHKEKIERTTGWGMVFVAGFILVLGLFSHDWWVLSGQHTFLEGITQEERFIGIAAKRLNVVVPHVHGLPPADHTGLFGLPLPLGTWVLLFLWILPMFWYYNKKKRDISSMADPPNVSADSASVATSAEGATLAKVEKQSEKKTLPYLFWNFITISVILVLVFGYILPHRFLEMQTGRDGGHMMNGGQMMNIETEGNMDDGGHVDTMIHGDGHKRGAANYHESTEVVEGPVVSLTAAPAKPKTGKAVSLKFFVHDAKTGAPITNLEIEHEKYMHVIGIRDDLNEFFHIHPQRVIDSSRPNQEISFIPGMWSVAHTFKKPGTYKIWTDIKANGEVHTFGQPLLTVEGEGAISEKEISFETEASVDGYRINIHPENLIAGNEASIGFSIKDKNENLIEVEPYLGTDMHLVAIKEDLSVYVHTHLGGPAGAKPEPAHSLLSPIPVAFANGGVAEEKEYPIHFNATFPSEGIYKLFAQFRPKGIALPQDEAFVASFYVEVQKAQPNTISETSQWWYKLIISIILIFILGWLVKKFITVPLIYTKKEK